MEETKGYASAFDQLMSGRQKDMVHSKGLCVQIDGSNQEIQARTAERQQLILKENLEVLSVVPQTDCRANRRRASFSDFDR